MEARPQLRYSIPGYVYVCTKLSETKEHTHHLRVSRCPDYIPSLSHHGDSVLEGLLGATLCDTPP